MLIIDGKNDVCVNGERFFSFGEIYSYFEFYIFVFLWSVIEVSKLMVKVNFFGLMLLLGLVKSSFVVR